MFTIFVQHVIIIIIMFIIVHSQYGGHNFFIAIHPVETETLHSNINCTVPLKENSGDQNSP